MPQRNTPRRDPRGRGFENSERLRELLTRLNTAGPDAWRTDPEAAALMQHAAQKLSTTLENGADPTFENEATGSCCLVCRVLGLDAWQGVDAAVA